MIEIIEALTNLITEAEHLWILLTGALGIGGGLVGGGVKTKSWWDNKKSKPRRSYDNGDRVEPEFITKGQFDGMTKQNKEDHEALDKKITDQNTTTNNRIDEVGKRIGELGKRVGGVEETLDNRMDTLEKSITKIDKTLAVLAVEMKYQTKDKK